MQPYHSYYNYPQAKYPQANQIEAMYQNAQPYNDKQFLLTTFQGRANYIRVFLNLPHSEKLKLFLLVEEQKMYGHIKDQQAYK